jgi:DNA-directed RNA polymerase specialized sigma24 family protein
MAVLSEAQTMSGVEGSVSIWLERLKDGNEEAAAWLWDRYFRRLLGLARARLANLRRQGMADEEDVVLSAFNDFCRAARSEGYAELRGRESLWRVLARFVANKAKTLLDRETAAKRGGGRNQGASAFGRVDDSSSVQGFDRVESRDPDPALAVEVEEEFGKVLARLSDQETEIACLHMEGYAAEEIAGKVGLSPATVRRRLAVIRDVLTDEFGDKQ